MKKIKGLPICSGYAIAPPLYYESEIITVQRRMVVDVKMEVNTYLNALISTKASIVALKQIAEKNQSLSDEERQPLLDVLDAHIAIANDPEFADAVLKIIKNEKLCSEYATQLIIDDYVAKFEALSDNPYFAERATDIKDVYGKVINHILGITLPDFTKVNHPCIIIATDIIPSVSVQFNNKFIKGLITEKGSKTSHSAIIANNLKIPLISGVPDLKNIFSNYKLEIILDGVTGDILLHPSDSNKRKYQELSENYQSNLQSLEKYAYIKTFSKDYVPLPVRLNIGGVDDFLTDVAKRVEGIGLYRTEFLFMNSSYWPTVSEQVKAYEPVLKMGQKKPIVIRTLDIGGDKKLPYFDFPQEDNPFLGYRAIRFCLDRVDIFKSQLKALLIANKYNNLKIMFPMIADVSELIQAQKILDDVYLDLKKADESISSKYQVGIMIETPASVMLADDLAKHVDFFSIGSNDLIQYTLAVDRLNCRLSYLYNSLSPAIIRSVKHVITTAHKNNIVCSMCGSMGGEALSLPLLMAMKIDSVSVSLSRVLVAKQIISKLKVSDCKQLLDEVLLLDDKNKIQAKIENLLMKHKIWFTL